MVWKVFKARNAPRCGLSSLPQECLDAILVLMAPHNILAVALASHHFYAASAPALYRRIRIDWCKPWRPVLALFRALTNHPELAVCVHHVSIMTSYERVRRIQSMDFIRANLASFRGRFYSRRMLKSMREEGILTTANNLVARARFPSHWTRVLNEGNPYFYAALFVAQLPNLRSLRLDYVLARNYGYLAPTLMHALFHAPANTLSSFEKLAVIEYGGSLTPNFQILSSTGTNLYLRPELSCKQSLAWFLLPSLRSLEARVGDEELVNMLGMIKGPNGRRHNLAHLERLVLNSCTAKEHNIARLLSLTRSVTSLHLGLGSWRTQEGNAPMTPLTHGMILLRSLLGLRSTLENLSIGLNLLSTHITDLINLGTCLAIFHRFLKRFPRLRTAEIQVTMLLGIYDGSNKADLAALLPPDLQSLCIRCYLHPAHDFDLGWTFPRIMRCIQDFLPHARAVTPNLERIYIHTDFHFPVSSQAESEVARARALALNLGLDLSIRVLSPWVLPGLWTRRRGGKDRRFIY